MSVHDKRIITQNTNGSIRIFVPVEPLIKNETENEYADRIILKGELQPGEVKVGVINKTALPFAAPGDTTEIMDFKLDKETNIISNEVVRDKIKHFRGAYRWDGTKIVIDTVIEKEIRWAHVREIRNKLLQSSDGEMAGQTEQKGPKQADMKTYRQNLRDLPETEADPKNIIWPTKP